MPPKAAAKKKTTPKKAATWQRTQSKATMPDGKKKTLYRHSETGEMRVRKMVTRGGKKVASYVSPSRRTVRMRGGNILMNGVLGQETVREGKPPPVDCTDRKSCDDKGYESTYCEDGICKSDRYNLPIYRDPIDPTAARGGFNQKCKEKKTCNKDLFCTHPGHKDTYWADATCQQFNMADLYGGGKGKLLKAAAKKEKVTAPQTPASWQRTRSKATMPDGKKKTLYRHSETGEVRVRKMVTRGGKKVATFICTLSNGGGLMYTLVNQIPIATISTREHVIGGLMNGQIPWGNA